MKVEVDTYLDEFFKATAFDSSSYKGNALINSNDTSKQEFLELRDSYLDSLICKNACAMTAPKFLTPSVFLSQTWPFP